MPRVPSWRSKGTSAPPSRRPVSRCRCQRAPGLGSHSESSPTRNRPAWRRRWLGDQPAPRGRSGRGRPRCPSPRLRTHRRGGAGWRRSARGSMPARRSAERKAERSPARVLLADGADGRLGRLGHAQGLLDGLTGTRLEALDPFGSESAQGDVVGLARDPMAPANRRHAHSPLSEASRRNSRRRSVTDITLKAIRPPCSEARVATRHCQGCVRNVRTVSGTIRQERPRLQQQAQGRKLTLLLSRIHTSLIPAGHPY